MIGIKQVEDDLNYLATTDEQYAERKATLEYEKNRIKSMKGLFVTQSNESVSKATEAYYGRDFKDHASVLNEINKVYLKLEAKRETAVLRIEVFRTLEATRRKGNI